MPAAKNMPRTRSMLLSARFGALFAIVGLLITVMSVIDLFNGKDALTETVTFGAILLFGVVLLVHAGRSQKTAIARDLASLPAGVRRDLPYGVQEEGDAVVLRAKLSWTVVLLLLAAGSVALVVLAAVDVDVTGPSGPIGLIVLVVLFCGIAGVLAFLAVRVRRLHWIIDAVGVRRGDGPHRIDWTEIGAVQADPRGRFVVVVDRDGARRLRFNNTILEVTTADLVETLGRGPSLMEPRDVDGR